MVGCRPYICPGRVETGQVVVVNLRSDQHVKPDRACNAHVLSTHEPREAIKLTPREREREERARERRWSYPMHACRQRGTVHTTNNQPTQMMGMMGMMLELPRTSGAKLSLEPCVPLVALPALRALVAGLGPPGGPDVPLRPRMGHTNGTCHRMQAPVTAQSQHSHSTVTAPSQHNHNTTTVTDGGLGM